MLTGEERAELVEELTSAMLRADPYYTSPHIDLAESCLPIIERLLDEWGPDIEPFLGDSSHDVPLKATKVEDNYRPLFPEFENMAEDKDTDHDA